jgi:hypothetical protein
VSARSGQRDDPFFFGKARIVQTRAKEVRIELDSSSVLGACTFWIPRRAFHAENEVFLTPNGGDVVVQHGYAAKVG